MNIYFTLVFMLLSCNTPPQPSVETAVEAKDKELAKGAFKNAESALDSMASKKVIHKNKAARIKSRLNKKVKTL